MTLLAPPPLLASPAMPRADVGAAGLPAAAAGLLFLALFFGDGTSSPRLFWIGAAAVVLAAAGGVWRPPPLRGTAAAFVVLLGALVLCQVATIAGAIGPPAAWD